MAGKVTEEGGFGQRHRPPSLPKPTRSSLAPVVEHLRRKDATFRLLVSTAEVSVAMKKSPLVARSESPVLAR